MIVIYFLTQGIRLISSEGVIWKFCSSRNNYYASFSSICNQARATPSALDCDSQHGPVSILSPDWLNFCLLGFGSIAPCYLKRNWGSKQLSWAIVTARGRSEQLGHAMQTWAVILSGGQRVRDKTGSLASFRCCSMNAMEVWLGKDTRLGKFSLASPVSREREESCHYPGKGL